MINLFLNLVLASDQQNTPNIGAIPSLAIQEEERAVSHFSLIHSQAVIGFDLPVVVTYPKNCQREYET